MIGDACAVPDCREQLRAGEPCYYVVQVPRDATGREQAVCWRHVRRGGDIPRPRVPGPGVVAITGCGLQPCGHPGCPDHCQGW
jgi:hypothetical protein